MSETFLIVMALVAGLFAGSPSHGQELESLAGQLSEADREIARWDYSYAGPFPVDWTTRADLHHGLVGLQVVVNCAAWPKFEQKCRASAGSKTVADVGALAVKRLVGLRDDADPGGLRSSLRSVDELSVRCEKWAMYARHRAGACAVAQHAKARYVYLASLFVYLSSSDRSAGAQGRTISDLKSGIVRLITHKTLLCSDSAPPERGDGFSAKCDPDTPPHLRALYTAALDLLYLSEPDDRKSPALTSWWRLQRELEPAIKDSAVAKDFLEQEAFYFVINMSSQVSAAHLDGAPCRAHGVEGSARGVGGPETPALNGTLLTYSLMARLRTSFNLDRTACPGF